MTHVLLVAGPDGSGKTTVADAIERTARCQGLSVKRVHHRPELLGRRDRGSEAPVTDPHGQQPRTLVGGLAKIAVVWLDWMSASCLSVLRRDTDVTIVERGWWDMAVDPRRYRLRPGLAVVVEAAGRLLPRAEVAVLLAGDPGAIHARKPEIGVTEVGRQIAVWRGLAARSARTGLVADAVQESPPQIAQQAVRRMVAQLRVWRRVPLVPNRVGLVWTGDPRPAQALYQPYRRSARVAAPARNALLRAHVGRRIASPVDLDELCRALSVECDGAALMQSSTPTRTILALSLAGRPFLIVKVAGDTDPRLGAEAAALQTLTGATDAFTVPTVRFIGTVSGRLTIATDVVPRRRSRPIDVASVATICTSLLIGSDSRPPLAHGDMAPWNLRGSAKRPVLLDWEHVHYGRLPLFDLAHYVVAVGSLTRAFPPQRARALLTAPDSPGWNHLQACGEDPGSGRSLLHSYYLSEDWIGGSRERRYWRELVER